jgi:hypothetical protein
LSILLFGLVVAIERVTLRWRYAAQDEQWEELSRPNSLEES